MYSLGSSPQYRKTHEISHEGGGESYMDFVDQTRLVSNVYAGQQSVVNGGFQIALGIICIICNITSLIIEPEGWGILANGIWGGATYIIAGELGILAGKTKVRGLIIAFLVVCVLTACIISPGAAICSGFGVATYSSNNKSDYDGRNRRRYIRGLISQIILLVMSTVQIGFAIWGCVISGKAVCSCCVRERTVPIDISPPTNSENFASQMAAGHQVQDQGQRVYPEGGASPVINANQRGALVYEGYHSFQSRISGAAQISIGILLVVFNATLIGLKPRALGIVCHGFWGGGLFIVTGAYGVVAANSKSRSAVIAYMTTSLVSMQLDVGVFSAAVADLVHIREDCFYSLDYDSCYGHRDAIIALRAVMIALAVLEGIFAIWGFALGAKFFCGCCRSKVPNKVQFRPSDQRLLMEDNIYPAPHNAGHSVHATPVAVANIYDSVKDESHAQDGPYAQPISQLKA